MFRSKVLLLLFFSFCAAAKEITFASYERFNYTNPDETGLYWDVLKTVYEPGGDTITIRYMPYQAAILALQKGQVDGIVGYPHYEDRGFIAPEYPLDQNKLVMAYDPFGEVEFTDMQSLKNRTVLLFKGYDFERFITVPFTRNSFPDMETGIKRLLRGNADVMIDFEEDIQIGMEALFLPKRKFIFKELLTYYTYVQFQNTEEGKALAARYDEQFKSLLGSPILELVYTGWGSQAYDDLVKLDPKKIKQWTRESQKIQEQPEEKPFGQE